jgi:murein DD-endopeptidase MepM/ murein hydrolase activator NlpD
MNTRRRLIILAAVFGLVTALAGAAFAPAQDLQSRLERKQKRLRHARSRDGVLTTTIQHSSARITSLTTEVASLRNREGVVQEHLETAQAELQQARRRLAKLRARLAAAVNLLENRLVAIYESSEPDMLTVILNSRGFDDLLSRVDYLSRLHEQDNRVVGQVRELRNEARQTVVTMRATRNRIAAEKAELERTRRALEAEQQRLAAARRQDAAARAKVRSLEADLSDHVEQLQTKIEQQLRAAAGPALAAGPVRAGSSGLIWPINGTITSPFGPRWGSFHPGIDIGAPTGTPIRAAAEGRVVMASYNGGYGNYTCIAHSGSLSTCYAHQSSFATSSGATVSQGEVIGYVGSTGFSTGPHLHFEVRVNGVPQDPLNYL